VQAGLVAIDLRPGVDRSRFLDSIADQMATWDESGGAPFVYPEAIRPATVANVAAMRAVPVLLAGMLALTMAMGLALAVAVAARSRRRELALLRSLGCIGRQLRATIRWQALTVVGVGLLGGIPFGLAVGRVTYGAFAGGLGVRPEPDVSLGWLLLLTGGSVATGLLAAVVPGRSAVRVCPGAVLREE
jgi:ABC-type antimicrobial peptide transport system permease subunit